MIYELYKPLLWSISFGAMGPAVWEIASCELVHVKGTHLPEVVPNSVMVVHWGGACRCLAID